LTYQLTSHLNSGRQPKTTKNNEKWFDEECKNIKKVIEKPIEPETQRTRKYELTPSPW
jgi:hypothetical protein